MTEPLKIDYVFPYVNCEDPAWQKQAATYFSKTNLDPVRFRDLGFLKYVMRGLVENERWLNSVIILVSSYSQIPSWMNTDGTNLRVVTHAEFMSPKHLPTFNSNAIEMFLADIPGLSEYVIYGNDDFIPLAPTVPGDYFTGDGVPRISYNKKTDVSTPFRKLCKRCWNVIDSKIPSARIDNLACYYRQAHEPQPITLAQLKAAQKFLYNDIQKSITRIRDNSKNLSQYIYFNYVIATDQCEKRSHYSAFRELNLVYEEKNIKIIDSQSSKWVCLNDTERTSLSSIEKIVDALERRYPNKCVYEK